MTMLNQPTQIHGGRPLHGQPLFTLRFKNGQLLKHQDSLSLSQFRSDGRLAAVLSEPALPPVKRSTQRD